MSRREALLERAKVYASRKSLQLGQELGSGVHGIVFAAENQPEPGGIAIKVHEREPDWSILPSAPFAGPKRNTCLPASSRA